MKVNSMRMVYSRPPILCIRRFFSKIDSTVVLNRDLYRSNAKLNSSNKVNYDGMKPTFYLRSGYDFESLFTHRKGVGSNRMLELLEQDREFQANIKSRLDPIQEFVGSKFPLNTMEKLSVVCGLSNFTVEIDKYITKNKVYIESEKLRDFGKHVLTMHIGLETIFVNQRYLSTAKSELDHDLDLFSNPSLISQFMKRNKMLTAVIPFRGAFRSGKIEDPVEYEAMKGTILNKTSIGSLYTLVGLLSTKFDKKTVIDKIILPKIIHGPLGIISIATNELTGSSTLRKH